MATTPYLLQRGSTWSWRRRVPEFSTKTRHWQLSLRATDRSIACIIARRLNYECDRMLDAITDGKLTPVQAKAWLTSVVRSELDRIERQRRVSRMDPVGSSEEDQRLDWATARAWSHLASEGLRPELSDHDRRTVLKEGSSETDIASLETMLREERKHHDFGHDRARPAPRAGRKTQPRQARSVSAGQFLVL
ncbi:DUF6538 domain-containing protein [Rhodovulum sulfidophilum]|uniref:DUF6538 domain-containing protein n=1 Tax=Rhodovulum sulfidophilum TaxID=35806 RepID=UPI001389F8BC|nr:DUF6538 domain-containing protein [Rhodovulum sulfidophilum]NDK36524.1 hypothetical protein [Rhodovulum sulfidophilum]